MIFYKTVSAGNDFLHVNVKDMEEFMTTTETPQTPGMPELKSRLAGCLCERRLGAGADGVIFYSLNNDSVDFQIFNRDGMEAELSGNGMAGLSSVLFYLGTFKDNITLNTRTGQKTHYLLNRDGNKFSLQIQIGEPDFSNRTFFPFLEDNRKEYQYRGIRFYPVSVGNPHAVLLMEKDLPDEELEKIGEMFESGDIFPRRTNVELVHFKDAENCFVYYYERGVGHTRSSSTGSAAVFSVLQNLKAVVGGLTVTTRDGTIKIYGKKKNIFVESYSKVVYKGNYFG
jgi:diaminopimelate epimerase